MLVLKSKNLKVLFLTIFPKFFYFVIYFQLMILKTKKKKIQNIFLEFGLEINFIAKKKYENY